jgi:hypothetical protein
MTSLPRCRKIERHTLISTILATPLITPSPLPRPSTDAPRINPPSTPENATTSPHRIPRLSTKQLKTGRSLETEAAQLQASKEVLKNPQAEEIPPKCLIKMSNKPKRCTLELPNSLLRNWKARQVDMSPTTAPTPATTKTTD